LVAPLRAPLVMAAFLAAVLLVAAAPGDPCTEASRDCPRAPCPSPPPGWNKFCEIDANPLVLNNDGLCCPSSMCTPYHCPAGCQTDAGTQFIATGRASSGGLTPDNHYYDCSRSTNATACFHLIEPQKASSDQCKCLISAGCISSASFLKQQDDSRCALACRDPSHTGQSICDDYDDENFWCDYYATWFCVSTLAEHGCDATRIQPKPTKCEAHCLANPPPSAADSSVEDPPKATPEDRLDRFLRCLGDCTQ